MKVQISSNNAQPGVAVRDVAVASALTALATKLCSMLLILVVRAAEALPVCMVNSAQPVERNKTWQKRAWSKAQATRRTHVAASV